MKFKLSDRFFEFFECATVEPFPTRPSIAPVTKSDIYFRYLKDEVHDWMISQNIEYNLQHGGTRLLDFWFLVIPNDRDAMLFKLTWI